MIESNKILIVRLLDFFHFVFEKNSLDKICSWWWFACCAWSRWKRSGSIGCRYKIGGFVTWLLLLLLLFLCLLLSLKFIVVLLNLPNYLPNYCSFAVRVEAHELRLKELTRNRLGIAPGVSFFWRISINPNKWKKRYFCVTAYFFLEKNLNLS